MQKIILRNVNARLNLLVSVLYFLIIIFFPANLFSYPQGWSKDTLLYKQGNSPQIFRVENIIGVVFLVKRTNQTSVYMQISYNKGVHWEKPRLLVQKIGKKFEYVACNADNNTLYVAWGEDDGYIYLLRYSFTNNQIISKEKLPDAKPFACLPKIYVDDKTNIHIFYHREVKELFTLYHTVSFDRGKSWSKSHKIVEKLSVQTRGLFFPTVVFWGDYILIVWQNRQGGKGDEKIDDELYFSFSKDLGQSWAYPHRLTNNKYNDSRPFLILGPDFYTLYLIWENNKQGDWDIYMLEAKIIDENTIEWEPESVAKLVSETSADSVDAEAIIKNDNLYIFWYDFRMGKSQLFYRIYDFRNKQFLEEIQLTDTKRHSKRPDVTLYSNIISLVWEERVEDYSEIYFKKEDREIETPIIYSPTHPANVWVANKDVEIYAKSIKDESGIKGYSYILDNSPTTIPDIINYTLPEFKVQLKNLEDGVYYFHLRAVDNNDNWSRTAHYKIQIDTHGPEITDLKIQPYKGRYGRYNVVFNWDYNDYNRIKGFTYKLSKRVLTELPHRVMVKSNSIRIDNVKDGVWFFHIKGVDSLGNWSELRYFRFILTGDDIPPTPPQILSDIQPESITTNNSPEFSFSSVDNTGIKGYNYAITINSNYILKNRLRTSRTNVKFHNLKDGRWYFMVKAVDYNDNWSQPSLLSFTIDHTPPKIKSINCIIKTNIEFITNRYFSTNIIQTNQIVQTNITEKIIYSTNTNIIAIFRWELGKEEKGVGYSFSLSTDRIVEPLSKIMTVLNYTKFENLEKKNYYFKLKVCDNLGNWSRSKIYKLKLKRVIRKKPVRKITGADLFIYDDILHYRIKQGDKLAEIIKTILLTDKPQLLIDSVAKYNNIKNIDLIYVGDVIKFPLLRMQDTIVIEKIKPSFLEYIKNKILMPVYTQDGIKIRRVKDLSSLRKGNLILIQLPIFLETGKFFFY